MKKIYLLLIVGLCFTSYLRAQVSKTLEVTSGNLSSLLTEEEKNIITSLTLIGTVDARDFIATTKMPLLTELDLSQTKVTAIYTSVDTEAAISYEDTIGSYGYNPRESRSLFSWWLKTIKLPSTLKVIGTNGFSDCRGLTSIDIPPTVTLIGLYAFYDCPLLNSINIPPSVRYIDKYAFFRCSGLKELIISPSIYSINLNTFYGCSSLTTLTIPNSVKNIGESSFNNCTALNTIILPDSLENIYGFAFINCPNITSIYSYNPIPPAMASNAFDTDKSICIVHVPYGSKSLYASAYGWEDFKNIIEILPFTLSETELSIEAVPNVESIQISSNGAWSATCDKEWLTLSPPSGDSSQTVTFTCQQNKAFEPRTATVTFSDGNGYSQTVNVTQKARINNIPIANAGKDQIVEEGEMVQLDGSGSTDSDSDSLTYQWTAPKGISLLTEDDAHPSFKAPKLEKDAIYTFNLVVNDGKVNSTPDQVLIAIQNKIIELGLSADSIVFQHNASSAKIFITGNAQWNISPVEDWLSVSPDSGEGQKEIQISALANETQKDRIAYLSISAPEVDAKTITVTQHGLITGVNKIANAMKITCYPNPFNDQITIEVANPSLKEINVEIYTILGQKIRTLLRAQKGAKINCTWDGRNENSKKVPNGMYLLKVNGEMRKVVKKNIY